MKVLDVCADKDVLVCRFYHYGSGELAHRFAIIPQHNHFVQAHATI